MTRYDFFVEAVLPMLAAYVLAFGIALAADWIARRVAK